MTDLTGRLRELAHAATLPRDEMLSEFTMRIPADPRRDADLVLSQAAMMLELDAKEIKAITTDYRTLHDAAKELILRMKVIHANDEYKSVWTLAGIHGNLYNGPTYEKELKALADAVELVQETAL